MDEEKFLKFWTKKKILIAIYILAILIFVLAVMVIRFIGKNSECEINPLIYGAQKVHRSLGIDLMCTCTMLSGDYAPFYFTKEEISVGRPGEEKLIPSWNFESTE